jgi:hypothetical protein
MATRIGLLNAMSRASAATDPVRPGSTTADYSRIGIAPRAIRPWEDGMRTDGSRGTYEWWYFDAHLDDGAKIIVVFLTKEFGDINRPLTPAIRIDLTLPDGTSVQQRVELPPGSFSASTETCDVRIGDNLFAGNLHTYAIRARVDDVEVDVSLTGQVPAWRPETGYFLFGEAGERYFAWLPSVPQGGVNVTYSVGGKRRSAAGVGYHDHNWGNASMPDLMHHWYWARGAAGPYSVIASYITTEKRYGYEALPVFMLARNGKLIGDDSGKVTFEELGRYTDTATGKPVGNITRYTYTDAGEQYVITFSRFSDLASDRFIDELKGPKKVAAMLIGFDGAYLRFTGELRLERYHGEQLVETYSDNALWELMYFGKARSWKDSERSREQ